MTFQIVNKKQKITFLSMLTSAVLISTVFTALPAYSQTIVFQDDYNTNTGWMQVNTGVTVDDPSFPDIVKFNAVGDGGVDRRVYKSIGTTLSDTEWILESEFLVNTHSGNPAHDVFVLSAGINDPSVSDQDMIGISYNSISGDPVGLEILSKDGTGTQIGHGDKIPLDSGQLVYLRLSRTSATEVTLEAFSDAARTIHIAGSPITATSIPATITGLNIIQHANSSPGGSLRNLTAEIDNTTIFSEGPLVCNGLTPTIEGTTLNDVLIGTSGDDVIVGLDGDDVIYGMGGNDTICGNEGNDFVRAGTGDDLVIGDGGKDVLLGDEGNDTLRGNAGDDRLVGGSGEDKLRGGNGNDVLVGGTEDDDLDGQADFDFCDISDPTDVTANCEATT